MKSFAEETAADAAGSSELAEVNDRSTCPLFPVFRFSLSSFLLYAISYIDVVALRVPLLQQWDRALFKLLRSFFEARCLRVYKKHTYVNSSFTSFFLSIVRSLGKQHILSIHFHKFLSIKKNTVRGKNLLTFFFSNIEQSLLLTVLIFMRAVGDAQIFIA